MGLKFTSRNQYLESDQFGFKQQSDKHGIQYTA